MGSLPSFGSEFERETHNFGLKRLREGEEEKKAFTTIALVHRLCRALAPSKKKTLPSCFSVSTVDQFVTGMSLTICSCCCMTRN